MKTLLAAIIFVGLAVLLLGVNIFFFKRPFPNGEISTNPEMQKRGIKCARQEELEMLAARKGTKLCDGNYSDACKTCSLYVTPGPSTDCVIPGPDQESQNN